MRGSLPVCVSRLGNSRGRMARYAELGYCAEAATNFPRFIATYETCTFSEVGLAVKLYGVQVGLFARAVRVRPFRQPGRVAGLSVK